MTTDLTPYAGRWVALVEGQVAGVGHTAVAAERAARHQRPRDKFQLHFVELPGPTLPLPPLMQQLRPLFAQYPEPVFLVGGAIRDALLGQTSHDLDFVLPQQAIKLAFKAADALGVPAFVLDRERGTARVVLSDDHGYLDFATFRGPDLTADLIDRDYTINAIALPVAAETVHSLIDPTNGQADLQAKRIRHIHAHSLQQDPIRLLRGLRLALRLGFELAPETAVAITDTAPQLPTASAERIRDELVKLLQGDHPDEAVRQLQQLQLLPVTLPDIARQPTLPLPPPHSGSLFDHTLAHLGWLRRIEQTLAGQAPAAEAETAQICAEIGQRLAPYQAGLQAHWQQQSEVGIDGRTLLRLAALYHDAGKIASHSIDADGRAHFLNHAPIGADLASHQLQQLALSNKTIQHVGRIIAGHSRPFSLAADPQPISRRDIFRYFHALDSAGLDVAVHALADHLASYHGRGPQPVWQALLAVVQQLLCHYFDHYQQTIAPTPLLNGRELMQTLNLPPGPEVGRLLHLIRENQATGDIQTREQAITFAQSQL